MFNVSVKVENTNPKLFEQIKKRAQKLARRKVAVGFPHGRLNAPHYQNKHSNEKPSIIDVAIWNNFGIGVPRRDFMTPATEKWQEWTNEYVNSLKTQILQGKESIDDVLGQIGIKGASIISDTIVELKDPPNSPITIHGGVVRKGGKTFYVEGKGSANPLFDSGDLSRAPTYELRDVEK